MTMKVPSNRRLAYLSVALLSTFACGFAQPSPGTLRWRAEIARQRGQTSVLIQTPRENDAVRPIKDLIGKSLIVDGTVESSSVDASDGYQIFTWYRVRIVSRGESPEWKGVYHQGKRPENISPARNGEILVRLYGGTTTVDGVTITQEQDPTLDAHKRYLFFLEPLSTDSFVLAYQSVPLNLDANGNLIPSEQPGFQHRFDKFRSSKDILNHANK